jgi:hypothetical protein
MVTRGCGCGRGIDQRRTLRAIWNLERFLSLDDLFETGSAARYNIVEIIALSTITLADALLAAVTSNTFRLQLAPTVWPRRFIGGGAMGFGIALIPGSNAVLILHSLPSLLPYAVPVYVALIIGSGATLLLSRTLRRSAHFARSSAQRFLHDGTPLTNLAREN